MRLLTVESDPSFGGGSEAMSLAVSRGLAERGHDVFLLHDLPGTMLPEYASFSTGIGRAALFGFGWRSPLRTIKTALAIARFARVNGCQAIFSSHLGLVRPAVMAGMMDRIPAIFHLGLSCSAPSPVDRFFYRSMAAGIAPSEHTKSVWLASGCRPEKLFCVPNWVDTRRFQPAIDRAQVRRRLKLPEDTPLIVYVGRIVREKGLDIAIRALVRVRERIPNAKVVTVGRRSEFEAELHKLRATLGLSEDAWIAREETSTPELYFAAADVACVPSNWEEPFGLTLLEAMACEVPVVATTVGVFPAIMGELGADMLVTPGDPGALSERLTWWLEHAEASRQRGAELRRRVAGEFGPERSLDTYERVIFDCSVRVEAPAIASTVGN